MVPYEPFFDWFSRTFKDLYTLTVSLLFTVLGYFLPIKNIIHALAILFVMDVLFGYLKSKILYKKDFSKTLIFQTMVPRLVVTIILVMLTFMWDTEFEQTYISTPNLIGWFIGGVLIVSIAKNMYYITKWGPILEIIETVKGNVKNKTHMDIKDKDKDNYLK